MVFKGVKNNKLPGMDLDILRLVKENDIDELRYMSPRCLTFENALIENAYRNQRREDMAKHSRSYFILATCISASTFAFYYFNLIVVD